MNQTKGMIEGRAEEGRREGERRGGGEAEGGRKKGLRRGGGV